ncbi:MAG: hypothetical protein LC781_05530 [Actinobacteria bacterium]|nr:hypothetical protein [Actinomycetota bacterium]
MRRIISILTVAAVVAAITAVAALPALAQQPGPTTLTATGVLVGPVEDNDPDPTPQFRLTDEATGTTYNLISGFVDLEVFVGQRVTIEGVRVPGIDPLAFNVTSVRAASPGGDTTTAPGGKELPATGGIPLLLPSVALIVGSGILGAAVLRRGR